MNKEEKTIMDQKTVYITESENFSISVTVILFIMIFMGCICYELLQNREAVIQAYEDNRGGLSIVITTTFSRFRSQEKMREVLAFLQEQTVSSGERVLGIYKRFGSAVGKE